MGGFTPVALNIKTPEQPDLLQKYSQLMALKNNQQTQALQQQEAPLRLQALQQQTQVGQLQLQQQQQAANDQKAITAAWTKFDGKDPSQLPKLVIDAGGSGQAAQAIAQKLQEQKLQASTIFKNQADAGKTIVETAKQKGDMLAGALTPLTDAAQVPDAQLPQALQNSVQSLVQSGVLDQQHAQAATQLVQSGDPAKIRQGLATFIKTNQAQSQILQDAHVEAQTAQAKAAPIQAAANAAQTAAHNAVEEKQGQQRIGLEGARLAFDKTRQGTTDDQAIEAQAQQIASGDVKGLSQARNNPFSRAVMARVYNINPKYTDSLYTATQDLRSSKPNSSGANATRLGTAILHADNALNNSKDLGFSTGLATGIPTEGTAAYRQDAEFLTGEVGQYVTGGKLTVDEGKKISSDLMSSRQGVRDSALHQIIALSGGKLKAQMEQYKNATQNDFPTDRVFNDPAIAGALHSHGVIDSPAKSGKPSAPPQGATHTAPGSDGKNHYTNDKGQDLGVAP